MRGQPQGRISYQTPVFLEKKLVPLSICLQVEKYDQKHLARKTSLKDCLTDVFHRQLVAGDPGDRGFNRQVIFACILICFFDIELCGKQIKPNALLSVTVQSVSLHFTVSCPQKTSRVEREEDAMVAHFLLESDKEEPEFQKIFVNKVRKSWNI